MGSFGSVWDVPSSWGVYRPNVEAMLGGGAERGGGMSGRAKFERIALGRNALTNIGMEERVKYPQRHLFWSAVGWWGIVYYIGNLGVCYSLE